MSIKDNSLPQNRKDFALVDVFFHRAILRPAYLVQLLIHQFDHMEMIEDMHSVRAVFKYRGDKSCREISGDILDVELLPSDPFSGIRPKHRPPCLTHMENPTALEVNDNGLQIQIYNLFGVFLLFRAASLQMSDEPPFLPSLFPSRVRARVRRFSFLAFTSSPVCRKRLWHSA